MSLLHCYYNPLTGFDRLFDDALVVRFTPSVSTDAEPVNLFRPRMDVRESKDSDTVTAALELPGMKPDDITTDIHQNRLTITGEARKFHSGEDEGYRVRERSYGKFSRTLQLPFGTKSDDVKAKMEDGVLSVTFPKTTPEQQAQRITIQ